MDDIETAQAEWASPIPFVPKEDDMPGLCVEYRELIAMTIRDFYPIPGMDECIHSLGDATIFSTLDANDGYWQVEIALQDWNKNGCTSHYELFRFTGIAFGLKRAPRTFQRAKNVLLTKEKWQLAMVYLNDIVKFLQTPKGHIGHVCQGLTILTDADVTINPNKRESFPSCTNSLGPVFAQGVSRFREGQWT